VPHAALHAASPPAGCRRVTSIRVVFVVTRGGGRRGGGGGGGWHAPPPPVFSVGGFPPRVAGGEVPHGGSGATRHPPPPPRAATAGPSPRRVVTFTVRTYCDQRAASTAARRVFHPHTAPTASPRSPFREIGRAYFGRGMVGMERRSVTGAREGPRR